ncbi:TetR family transcriptional regulator [Acidipropionibacterium jensenii]|nr:TetR family transcriptional regulator [Acidipropionibacterium jensenii]
MVADRAGVPLGATTYYFVSLHELRAAAVTLLASRVSDELAAVSQEVRDSDGDPRVLAELLHDYLIDEDQIRADAALYSTAMQHEDLRSIALMWVEGFVELAEHWTSPESARSIAVFIDGATVQTALSGNPPDIPTLEGALTGLINQGAAGHEE